MSQPTPPPLAPPTAPAPTPPASPAPTPLTSPVPTAATTTAPAPPAASRRRPSLARRLLARARTLTRLILHFLHPARFVLAPLLLVLLLAGVLLWLTGGLAYVAPFVYTLF